MNRYYLTLATAVCCALSLYYLDGELAQQQKVLAERNAFAGSLAVEKRPIAAEVVARPSEDKLSSDQKSISETLKLAFEPPFPERTNLFQAPKRKGGGRSSSQGLSEISVELLGFVNVGGQRVALSINGMVWMVAEGEKQNGIEVISIQPPAVVLQRGRQRWQASFEN